MLKIAMMTALGVALVLPAAAQSAESRSGKRATSTSRYVHAQAPASCTYCYTCGGDWQVFSGAIYNPSGAAYEYTSSCGGSQAWASDAYPYLCCN